MVTFLLNKMVIGGVLAFLSISALHVQIHSLAGLKCFLDEVTIIYWKYLFLLDFNVKVKTDNKAVQ